MVNLIDIQNEVEFRDKESKTKELLMCRLIAEIGELVNYMTKEIMRGHDYKDMIESELPDVLFYLTRIVNHYGLNWEDIWKKKMEYNSKKYNVIGYSE